MASHSTDRDKSLAEMDLGRNFDQLRSDVQTLTETVARLASEAAASARSQVRDSAGRAARGANAAGDEIYRDAAAIGRDAADTAHVATAQLASQIARNPIATVLVALGLGFAIGVISRR